MFHCLAKLEFCLSVKYAGVGQKFLQKLRESSNLFFHYITLGCKALLNSSPNRVDGILNLFGVSLNFFFFGFNGDTGEQLFHEGDEFLILKFLFLDLVESSEEFLLASSFEIDLFCDFDIDCIDTLFDARNAVHNILLELIVFGDNTSLLVDN